VARRSLGTLTLDLIAKIGGFVAGMTQAERVAADRSRRIQRRMNEMGRSIRNVFALIGGAALVRSIVRATTEQENALRQLDQRLKSTGGAAGIARGELIAMANEMQRVTTFADDAVLEMQGLLLAFTNIKGDNFHRTTEAVLDLSTALGQDLPASAKLLGLALNDPAAGLSRLSRAGISLDEDQKKLIKRMAETGDVFGAQTILLDELAKRYGGSARAATDTFGGSIEQLKNAFGDLLEGEGGVGDATAQVKEFTSLLQDPKTKQAAQDVTTALFTGLAAVLPILRETVDGFRVLFGGATDIEKFDNQIELLRRKLEGEGPLDIPGILNLGFIEDAPVFIAGSRALQREIDALIQKRNELLKPPPAAATFTGVTSPSRGSFAPSPLPESEEFAKLRDNLAEQIALFGKTGEAAKLAYQIQTGAIEGLTEAEGAHLLRLARQVDALTKAADAAKTLKDAYEAQEGTYERQVGLINAVTEADKLRFELTSGNLKDLADDQAQYLLGLAQQIDQAAAAESLAEINTQILELKGNTAEAVTIRFDVQHEDLRKQLEQVGDTAGLKALDTLREMTAQQAEFNELRAQASRITEGLAIQEERIRNSQEAGAIGEFEALSAIGEQRTLATAQLAGILGQMDALAAASSNPELVDGVRAFRAELEGLQATANLLGDLIETSIKEPFANAFSAFIEGSSSAKDAFRSLIDDMKRRLADLAANAFADVLFGSISSLFGGTATAAAGAYSGGGGGGALFPRAAGGPVIAGESYLVGEQGPERFIPGESGTIVPNANAGVVYAPVTNVRVDSRADRAQVRQEVLTISSEVSQRNLERFRDYLSRGGR
jgi:hypothetical protein